MRSVRPELRFSRHTDVPDVGSAALLVIDFQQVFTDPASPAYLTAAPPALRRARALIRAFRAAGRPLAFTRHVHRKPPPTGGMGSWWSHFILDGDPGANLSKGLEPGPGEFVVRKSHYSAFRHTRLPAWLASQRASTLVLCGVMTHVCVDTTARDAFMRGFDVIVAGDACASKDPALHDASLLCLSHAVARVMPVRRIIASLSRTAGGR